MIEYDNVYIEYINGAKYIYDEQGNLIAVEHENGLVEYN